MRRVPSVVHVCSCAPAARSRFQETVRAIRYIAIAAEQEVEDDDGDVHADAEGEQQRRRDRLGRGRGRRSAPAWCRRRPVSPGRASRASRRRARAARCGSLAVHVEGDAGSSRSRRSGSTQESACGSDDAAEEAARLAQDREAAHDPCPRWRRRARRRRSRRSRRAPASSAEPDRRSRARTARRSPSRPRAAASRPGGSAARRSQSAQTISPPATKTSSSVSASSVGASVA